MGREFMSEDVDDFTYWANLSTDTELGVERLKKITSWIEGQIRTFVGILQAKGIKHVEYHIFSFDTRSILIVLGYKNEAYLTLSLEDIDIEDDSLGIRKLGVSSWIGTHDRIVMKEFNYEEIPLNESISIGANSLLNFLIIKYNGTIAEKYNFPKL